MAVCGELEVECQPGGAAGKVAGDVDVRVVACVGGDDVVDGVGDSGDLGAPGADGVDPDPLDAFVLDDGVFGELGEVCVDVGLRGEAELSADERRGIGHVSPYAEGLSGGGQGAAVEDVLGAGDGAGAVGDEEGDEFGGVVGLCRSAERDAAEGVHDLLKGGVPADTGAAGDAVD